MSTVERTDAQLVGAYRAGEVSAFDELHRRYVGSIYRLVRRKLGDGLLAEDIAQETFMKSLRTMDKVDEAFNFGGWVHTVARNLCYDELRRRQRDPRVEVDETDDQDPMMQLPAPAAGYDPVTASENSDLRRHIWEVSQRLPEKYRLVLTLRELQGLSYRRIGVVMKISESAVETLLYRARLRFKEEFIALDGRSGGGLSCEETLPLIQPYLSEKLRRPQAEAVRRHLAACVKCSRRIGAGHPNTRVRRRAGTAGEPR